MSIGFKVDTDRVFLGGMVQVLDACWDAGDGYAPLCRSAMDVAVNHAVQGCLNP